MIQQPVEIDENLYSRQLYVLGLEAMKKLVNSSVLISGMGGLGVEIAKNIILTGVMKVTIHDRRNTELRDLASNFFFTEQSIGKNRAMESLRKLAELNNYVTVNVKTDELTEEFLKNYSCVVITDYHPESEIKRISSICHSNGIKLILTDTRGVFAYAFNDFGTDFIVMDPTGEHPSRFLLGYVRRSTEGVVATAEDEVHGLGDGDKVTFEEVEGMTELNGKTFSVKIIDRRHFSIGDTSQFGEYTCQHRNGYGNQVIVPQSHSYKEFTEALKDPNTMQLPFDYCSFGQDQQVILAFVASQHYMDKSQKTVPEVSGDDLMASAREVNEVYHLVEEIDESLIREFARESGAVISPTCATFGGIVGLEVIKAVTAKFTPLNQFLAMGYISALPKDRSYTIHNDRYDPYRIVFGDKQQEEMQKLRYFMIGAGAIGCEQLKNWALMGVATRDEGKVIVTDMESIKRSNLNRQFLFRNNDIGKMKSDVAASAAYAINKEFQIESHQNRIGPESAHIYNDTFYSKLSGVCNALDNVNTRLFSDSKCVFYNKPLLESGTLGTKAHYQVVVPNMTESYGSQIDPPEMSTDLSTINYFPSNIDHCCQWAREQFSHLFEEQPLSINVLIHDSTYIKKMKTADPGRLAQQLMNAYNFLTKERCDNFIDCVKWARMKFEEYFNYKIRDFQNQHPENLLTELGLPFWTGNKRYPTPITFDPKNQFHAEFVTAAAILHARVWGIKPEGNILELAAAIQMPKWEAYKIATELNVDKQKQLYLISDDLEQLIAIVEPQLSQLRELHPESFEKDDDSNGHMDFVVAAASIRALNYQIKLKDKLEIKRIAGKIIPAIATTTAMISGLVALEMYKVHCVEHDKKVEDFRFGCINLALPIFNITEAMPCEQMECQGNNMKFTLWNKWFIEGDLTLQQFFDAVRDKYHLNVDMVTIGNKVVYPAFGDMQKSASRLSKKITDILVQDLKEPPLNNDQYLIPIEALCVDLDGNDVENTPQFVLKLR